MSSWGEYVVAKMRAAGFVAWNRPRTEQSFQEQARGGWQFMLGPNGPHLMRESTTVEKIHEVYDCPCTWVQYEDENGLPYFVPVALDPKCKHHGEGGENNGQEGSREE